MEWDKLRELMWSENCIISPGGFYTSVSKVAKIKDKIIFTGHAQNDLTEFLIFIIDCFHNAIMREALKISPLNNFSNNSLITWLLWPWLLPYKSIRLFFIDLWFRIMRRTKLYFS